MRAKPVLSPKVPSLQTCGKSTRRNIQLQEGMKHFLRSYWFTQKKSVVLGPLSLQT
jgi:hypothetical protein